MDEKLIETVKKFPCLWDKSSKFYKCNETKDAAWERIVKETDLSDVQNAKTRWKQLRDNHRDALKRQNGTRSGQARQQRKEWKHQDAMSFLLPHMKSSNFVAFDDTVNESSNMSNSIGDDASRDSCDSMPENSSNLQSSLFVNVSDSTSSANPSKPEKRKNDENMDSDVLKKIKQEPRPSDRDWVEVNTTMGGDKNDEIDLFFLSMAASTKKLPYHLQLQIKKACFNAVITAEENI